MARPSYKSEKRKKEILRQKKQEEKRQKRFNKAPGSENGLADAATLEGLGLVLPPAEGASEDAADSEGDSAADGEDTLDPQSPPHPEESGSNR